MYIFVKNIITMITPQTTRRKLSLSKYGIDETFEIFRINKQCKYDFTDNLDFVNRDGVYIFIKCAEERSFNKECTKIFNKWEMLYCGKTQYLRQRFNNHHRKNELKEIEQLYIAVCFCENEQEITYLENKMLNTFLFEYNKKDNNVLIAEEVL